MLKRFSLAGRLVLLLAALGAALAGNLKLDVLGEIGAGAKNQADVIAPGGKVVAKAAPGATVALPPGIYTLRLPIVGGAITRDGVMVEAGRTHTVLIENVAVLTVAVKDRTGKDPGLGVTVMAAGPPHNPIATLLSGDKVLFAPAMVDVKVDAPPQGYYWHAVRLEPGRRTRLTLNEVVPGELVVQPVWSKIAIDKATRVVVYRAGSQSQVAVSPPAPEHRFRLDPGDYDIYVENDSGKGRPYATAAGIHIGSGATVERQIPLDEGK